MNIKVLKTGFTTISIILSLSLNSAFAANNYGFTPTQIQQLKLLNIPIIKPAYIPKGYTLKSINIINSGSKIGSNYKLVYDKILNNGKISEFYIETVNDSIGHIFLSNPVQVKTKFGETQIYVDSSFENDTPGKMNNCIVMEWVRYKDNYYRFGSGGGCNIETKDDGFIQRISKEEAVKIISSFQELK